MGTRGGNLPVTLGIDASLRRPGLALLDAGGALVAAQHNERVRYCTRVTDSLRNRAATAY